MPFHKIKMNFILDDNIFSFNGCIEQIGMHRKFSQVFSVGPKTPVTPGTSLSNGILSHFLKFSLIFTNMQFSYRTIGCKD